MGRDLYGMKKFSRPFPVGDLRRISSKLKLAVQSGRKDAHILKIKAARAPSFPGSSG